MAKVPTGGKWLKASDLKPGDSVKILTEADWEESTYKGEVHNQFVCEVDYKGEKRKLKLTMASCKEIAPVYGEDSKEWIGKMLNLESVKVMAGGGMKYSIFATPIGGVASDEEVPWDK